MTHQSCPDPHQSENQCSGGGGGEENTLTSVSESGAKYSCPVCMSFEREQRKEPRAHTLRQTTKRMHQHPNKFSRLYAICRVGISSKSRGSYSSIEEVFYRGENHHEPNRIGQNKARHPARPYPNVRYTFQGGLVCQPGIPHFRVYPILYNTTLHGSDESSPVPITESRIFQA